MSQRRQLRDSWRKAPAGPLGSAPSVPQKPALGCLLSPACHAFPRALGWLPLGCAAPRLPIVLALGLGGRHSSSLSRAPHTGQGWVVRAGAKLVALCPGLPAGDQELPEDSSKHHLHPDCHWPRLHGTHSPSLTAPPPPPCPSTCRPLPPMEGQGWAAPGQSLVLGSTRVPHAQGAREEQAAASLPSLDSREPYCTLRVTCWEGGEAPPHPAAAGARSDATSLPGVRDAAQLLPLVHHPRRLQLGPQRQIHPEPRVGPRPPLHHLAQGVPQPCRRR